MKFYNDSRSNYEELISYYPIYYRDVDEMEAILKYFGGICDDMEARTEQAFLNNFILWADEETIRRWEDFLKIVYDKPLSLEQRRRVVLGRISGNGHIGEPEIKVIVGIYTDCPITVDFKAGVIYIDIDGEIFDEGNLYETLLGRIPAHLALKMTARTIRKFPMTLHIRYGGAIGQEIQAKPVSRDRSATRSLSLAQGAFDTTWANVEITGAKRRQETALSLTKGAYETAHNPSRPHTNDREQRVEVPFTGAGAFGTERKDTPPAPERPTETKARSSGGFYCRTHIKTKRIKEDK